MQPPSVTFEPSQNVAKSISYSAAKALRDTNSPASGTRGMNISNPGRMTIAASSHSKVSYIKDMKEVRSPEIDKKKARSLAVSKTAIRGGVGSSAANGTKGGDNNNNGGFLRPKVLDFQPKAGQMDPLGVNRSRKASRTNYNFVKRY